jgi:hypothetical protein
MLALTPEDAEAARRVRLADGFIVRTPSATQG